MSSFSHIPSRSWRSRLTSGSSGCSVGVGVGVGAGAGLRRKRDHGTTNLPTSTNTANAKKIQTHNGTMLPASFSHLFEDIKFPAGETPTNQIVTGAIIYQVNYLVNSFKATMPTKYTPEQFWQLYEKLPQELKDALFSEETGDNIYQVCQRYEVQDKLGEIVDLVGQVLAGVLPAEDFPKPLEKDLNLEKETAKKVAQEINRFVFYPVREELAKIYSPAGSAPRTEAVLPKIPLTEATLEAALEKNRPIAKKKTELGPAPETEEERKKPAKEDVYREVI